MAKFNYFFVFLITGLLALGCHPKPDANHPKTAVKFSQNKVTWASGKSQALPASRGHDTLTTLFLVRHAEKGTGDDPGLTAEGKARAERMAGLLKEAGITRVYSTNYKRTLATAEPLARRLRIAVGQYDARSMEDAAAFFNKNFSGEKVLIVGHSNTTPNLVNLLVRENALPQIPDDVYNNLYVVFLHANGRVDWWPVKF